MMFNIIKIKVKTLINKLINKLIDKEIYRTFENIYYFNTYYKIIWIILLPVSTIFIIINVLTMLVSIISYFSIFFYKYIKIKFIKKNKKVKNLIYKRRFKFLKNFYLIILEKILITYPKQKAFLIFYLISKAVYEKNMKLIDKKLIPDFLKSISNRIIIVIILSLPYILIYCNTNLVSIIKDIKSYEHENNEALLDSILVNIVKDLTNDYNKLILKLKIKFFKKKIIFNSEKDLMNALRYKKEFHKNFNVNKKYFRYLMIKQKIQENKYSKEHFTAISGFKDESSLYINETSQKEMEIYKYSEKLKEYIKEKIKNNFIHKGTIKEKKTVFYTNNIITEKKNILVINNYKNNTFLKNLKEEKLNNILASLSLNLDEKYLETKMEEINGVKKNILVENINLKKTIDLYKEKRDLISQEQFESILGMQFFWEENNKIIDNLEFYEKLKLCNDLNMEINSSSKEINFQIFKNIINKK